MHAGNVTPGPHGNVVWCWVVYTYPRNWGGSFQQGEATVGGLDRKEREKPRPNCDSGVEPTNLHAMCWWSPLEQSGLDYRRNKE